MNPPDVDRKIIELSDLLETQARANWRQAVEGAELEAAYRLAKSRAQLQVRAEPPRIETGKLTEAHVEALVTEAVHEELRARLIAQAKHEAGRDALFATRARLDALRTIAASTREAARG